MSANSNLVHVRRVREYTIRSRIQMTDDETRLSFVYRNFRIVDTAIMSGRFAHGSLVFQINEKTTEMSCIYIFCIYILCIYNYHIDQKFICSAKTPLSVPISYFNIPLLLK